MAVHHPSAADVDGLLDALLATPKGAAAPQPLALKLTLKTTDDVELLIGALRRHRSGLATRCVGVAAVCDDADVRAAVLLWPGRVACPLTALADPVAADGWLAGQLAAGPLGVRPRGGSRTVGLSPLLAAWLQQAQNPAPDPIAARIARESQARYGNAARMCIGENQGRFLKLLVELLEPTSVVEVGTFTGTSALWLARGLSPEGHLGCYERNEEPLEIAWKAWLDAGVAEQISVTIGPAAEKLALLPQSPCVDFAFIDADKEGYATYFDLLLPRLTVGGIIAFDNMLWGGTVADPRVDDADTEALRTLTRRLAADPTLDVLLVPVGDGVTLVRRRATG